MTVLKGSLIPSRITEAQTPLSQLLPCITLSPLPSAFLNNCLRHSNGNYSRFQHKRATRPLERWVKFDNSPLEMAQGMTENNFFFGVFESFSFGYDLGDASML